MKHQWVDFRGDRFYCKACGQKQTPSTLHHRCSGPAEPFEVDANTVISWLSSADLEKARLYYLANAIRAIEVLEKVADERHARQRHEAEQADRNSECG